MEYKTTKKMTSAVISEFLRINKEKGLTAENIVDSATKPSSPLHEFFEWDDTEAGRKYRLHQARVLVNEVKVMIDEKEYYAFESINPQVTNVLDANKREYKPVIEILSDKKLREQVVKSALHHLAYWESQYSKYGELKPIIKTATKVRERLQRQWQKKKK